MTEVKNMETMIATENQQEATEVMAFLGELEPQEKKDFLVFMQGIRLQRAWHRKLRRSPYKGGRRNGSTRNIQCPALF